MHSVPFSCIQEPTFLAKSTLLTKLFSTHLSHSVTLSFSQGWDTLLRMFDPKYYPDNSIGQALETFFTINGSSIACARRGDVSTAQEAEFLSRQIVERWVAEDKVQMFSLGQGLAEISSTKVRKLVGEWDGIDEQDLRQRLEPWVVSQVVDVILRDGLYRN